MRILRNPLKSAYRSGYPETALLTSSRHKWYVALVVALTTVLVLPLASGIVGSMIGAWAAERAESGKYDGSEAATALPLRMQLVRVEQQRKGHIVVRLDVTNAGKESIAWDREFVAPLTWQVRTEAGPLRHTDLGSVPQPTADEVQKRFVLIDPGQTLSKEFDLAEPMRVFVGARGLLVGGKGHVYSASEDTSRITVPTDAQALWIKVDYQVPGVVGDVFPFWFGKSAESLGLWASRTESNELTFEIAR